MIPIRIVRMLVLLCLASMPLAAAAAPAPATTEQRLTRLERRVTRMDSLVSVGIMAASICALWAQNTARNAWRWFFAGLLFSVITLLLLLYKNAEDIRTRPAGPRPPPGT
jgi:hypothetical protein